MAKSLVQKQIWGEIAKNWANFTPPGRPSISDCRIYNLWTKKTIAEIQNPKILVLGVTPEIRNLLFPYSLNQNAQIYLTDVNKDMFRAMRVFLNFTNRNEYFTSCDWLKLPFKRNFFDLVIGDLILSQLTREGKIKLLRKIFSILKPCGRFITRTCVFPKIKKEKCDLLKTFQKYFQQYKEVRIGFREALNYFWQTILDETYYLNDKKEYSLKYLVKDIQDLSSKLKSPLEKKFYQKFIQNFEFTFLKIWIGITKEEQDKIIQSYFKIEKIQVVRDHLFGDKYLIYVLKK